MQVLSIRRKFSYLVHESIPAVRDRLQRVSIGGIELVSSILLRAEFFHSPWENNRHELRLTEEVSRLRRRRRVADSKR
jgi:hypothetical protein